MDDPQKKVPGFAEFASQYLKEKGLTPPAGDSATPDYFAKKYFADLEEEDEEVQPETDTRVKGSFGEGIKDMGQNMVGGSQYTAGNVLYDLGRRKKLDMISRDIEEGKLHVSEDSDFNQDKEDYRAWLSKLEEQNKQLDKEWAIQTRPPLGMTQADQILQWNKERTAKWEKADEYNEYQAKRKDLLDKIEQSKVLANESKGKTPEQTIQGITDKTKEPSPAENLMTKGFGNIQESNQEMSQKKGFWYEAGKMTTNVLPSVLAMGASMIPGAGGVVARGVGYLNIGTMGAGVAGNFLYDYDKYQNDHGYLVDPVDRYQYGIAGGLAEIIPEVMGLEYFIPKGFMAKTIGKQILESGLDKQGRKVIVDFAQKNPQIVRQIAKNTMGAAIVEGGEEVITEGSQILTENDLKDIDDGTGFVEGIKRMAVAGAMGAAMGGFLGPLQTVSINVNQKQAREKRGAVTLAVNKNDNDVFEITGTGAEGQVEGYTRDGQRVTLAPDQVGSVIDVPLDQYEQILKDIPKHREEALNTETEIYRKEADDRINRILSEATRPDGNIIEASVGHGETKQPLLVIAGDVKNDQVVVVMDQQGKRWQVSPGTLTGIQEGPALEYGQRMQEFEYTRIGADQLNRGIQSGIIKPPTPEDGPPVPGTIGRWTDRQGNPQEVEVLPDRPDQHGNIRIKYESEGDELTAWISPSEIISPEVVKKQEQEAITKQKEIEKTTAPGVNEEEIAKDTPKESTGVVYTLPSKGKKEVTLPSIPISNEENQINKVFNSKPEATLGALKKKYPKRTWRIVDQTENDPDAEARYVIIGKSTIKPTVEAPIKENLKEPDAEEILPTEELPPPPPVNDGNLTTIVPPVSEQGTTDPGVVTAAPGVSPTPVPETKVNSAPVEQTPTVPQENIDRITKIDQKKVDLVGELARSESGLPQKDRDKMFEAYRDIQNANTVEEANDILDDIVSTYPIYFSSETIKPTIPVEQVSTEPPVNTKGATPKAKIESNLPDKAKENGFTVAPQGGIIKKVGDDKAFRRTRIIDVQGRVVARRTFKFQSPMGENSAGNDVEYKTIDEAIDGENKWVNEENQTTPLPVEPESKGEAVQKEPWEMTKKEYANWPGKELPEAYHFNEIVNAIREGKPVPPGVLADYPELKPKEDKPVETTERVVTKPVSEKYYSFTSNEFVEQPNGQPVKLNVPGDFFSVKNEHGEFSIFESTSGMGIDINTRHKTLKSAIEGANRAIAENAKKLPLDKILPRFIEKNGLSPRYTAVNDEQKDQSQPAPDKPAEKPKTVGEKVFGGPKKEVWQMPFEEFYSSIRFYKSGGVDSYELPNGTKGIGLKGDAAWFKKVQLRIIEKAKSEGKIIPKEVMSDYPELSKPKPNFAGQVLGIQTDAAKAKEKKLIADQTKKNKDFKEDLLNRLGRALKIIYGDEGYQALKAKSPLSQKSFIRELIPEQVKTIEGMGFKLDIPYKTPESITFQSGPDGGEATVSLTQGFDIEAAIKRGYPENPEAKSSQRTLLGNPSYHAGWMQPQLKDSFGNIVPKDEFLRRLSDAISRMKENIKIAESFKSPKLMEPIKEELMYLEGEMEKYQKMDWDQFNAVELVNNNKEWFGYRNQSRNAYTVDLRKPDYDTEGLAYNLIKFKLTSLVKDKSMQGPEVNKAMEIAHLVGNSNTNIPGFLVQLSNQINQLTADQDKFRTKDGSRFRSLSGREQSEFSRIEARINEANNQIQFVNGNVDLINKFINKIADENRRKEPARPLGVIEREAQDVETQGAAAETEEQIAEVERKADAIIQEVDKSVYESPDHEAILDQYVQKMTEMALADELKSLKERNITPTEEQIQVARDKGTQQYKDSFSKLYSDIQKKDYQALADRLHLGNKNSRKFFTAITGVELPKTLGATKETLWKFTRKEGQPTERAQPEVKPKLTAEEAIKKMQDAKNEKILQAKINYGDDFGILTRKQFVEKSIKLGHTVDSQLTGKLAGEKGWVRVTDENRPRLEKEGYKISMDYRMKAPGGSYHSITKAEFDYANELLAKQEPDVDPIVNTDDPTVEPATKLEDFGEKIGGARKDQIDLSRRGGGSSKETEAWWMKDWKISENQDGTFTVFKARDHFIAYKSKRVHATRNEAINEIKLLNVILKYGVSSRGESWIVYRRVSKQKSDIFKEGFTSKDEAMKYLAENMDYLLDFKPQFPERPHIEDLKRTGPSYRDKDATIQMFTGTFGFRGGEFGNWIPQDERQRILNMAYDGLMDLSRVLGIPPKAISLGGQLSIAFGSRGHGLTGAAAHYEPNRAVFNLTRMKGAGSVAHEWFHALDNYFGLQNVGKDFTKNESGIVIASKDNGTVNLSEKSARNPMTRQEVRDAFASVMSTIYKQPKIVEVSLDRFEKQMQYSLEKLEQSVKYIRGYIERERSYGPKKKPATPEQLKKFDELIERIKKGDLGETVKIITQESAYTKRVFGDLVTREVFKSLNDLLKSITGRGYYKRDAGWVRDMEKSVFNYNNAVESLNKYKLDNKEERNTPTKFHYDAKDLDRMRSSDYWSLEHEMAARAFEAYVEDQVEDSGQLSQYLVHSTYNSIYKILYNKSPYPEGVERERINEAFKKLFGTIQTRSEGDQEIMFRLGLFSRGKISHEEVVSIHEELARKAPKAPKIITLRESSELPPRILQHPNFNPDVKGVVSPHGIFAISSNLTSREDVIANWVHEVGAHHGLRNIFPDTRDYDDALKAVWYSANAHAKNNPEFRRIIKHINENYRYDNDPEIRKGNEFIAFLAQKITREEDLNPVELSIWRKFINRIREILMKLFNFKAETLSVKDIEDITRASVQSNFHELPADQPTRSRDSRPGERDNTTPGERIFGGVRDQVDGSRGDGPELRPGGVLPRMGTTPGGNPRYGRTIPAGERIFGKKRGIDFRIVGPTAIDKSPILSHVRNMAEQMERDKDVTIGYWEKLSVPENAKAAKEIFLATGMQRGLNGEWRFDIPDTDFEINLPANLSSLLAIGIEPGEKITRNITKIVNPKWGGFNDYPELKNVDVVFENDPENLFSAKLLSAQGQMQVRINTALQAKKTRGQGTDYPDPGITGGAGTNRKEYKRAVLRVTLLHELQHAIQNAEGYFDISKNINIPQSVIDRFESLSQSEVISQLDHFSPGWQTRKPVLYEGIINNDPGELNNGRAIAAYFHNAQEVEAYNTETRDKLSQKEREEKPLSETEKIPREQQWDGEFNSENEDINFRIEHVQKMPDGQFAEEFKDFIPTMRAVENKWIDKVLTKTYQDAGLAIKNLEREVERRGYRITMDKSPYFEQNRTSGSNRSQIEDYYENYEKPLIEMFGQIKQDRKVEFHEIEAYLKAKHGIERNRKMNLDSDKDRIRGGIPKQMLIDRGLKKDGSNAEEIIQGVTYDDLIDYLVETVDKTEKRIGELQVEQLWNLVHKATNFTLDRWWKDGFISLDHYLELTGANGYKNYVPLRGWKGDTTDMVFEYLNNDVGGAFNPNKKAFGRLSEADDVIPYIFSMAGTAIVSGNKNAYKRMLLDLAREHKGLSDLVRVMYTYEVKKPDGTWENVGTTKPDKELFDQKLARINKDTSLRQRNTKSNAGQHEVDIFEGGQRYTLLTDPQVAAAINGDNMLQLGKIGKFVGSFTRFWAAWTTSKNPAFIIPNMARDFRFALRGMFVENDPKMTGQFFLNYGPAHGAIMRQLSGRKGKTARQRDVDNKYQQFRMNGGITGYTRLEDIERIKAKMEKEAKWLMREKNTKGKLSKDTPLVYMRKLLRLEDQLTSNLAEWSENIARFATFLTYLESGRSVKESTTRAKEATTNFDRKGSQSAWVNAGWAFFNARVQGIKRYADLWKASPVKMAAFSAMDVAIGFGLAALMDNWFNDDPDEEGTVKYDKVNPFVRRNYFNVPIPGRDKLLSIPNPHSFAFFHAMGSTMYDVMTGRTTPTKAITSSLDSFTSNLLPVDLGSSFNQEGKFTGRPFIPTFVVPVWDLILNEDFAGRYIFREPFTKEMEERMSDSQMYKYGTAPFLIKMTNALYEATGGDVEKGLAYYFEDGKKKHAWGSLNPSSVEHLLEGYLSGKGQFYNQVYKLVRRGINPSPDDKPLETYDIPVVNRFVRSAWGDPVKEEYFDKRKTASDILYEYKQAKKISNKEGERIKHEIGIPQYNAAVKVNNLQKQIDDINEDLNSPKLSSQRKDQLMTRKRTLMRQINALEL